MDGQEPVASTSSAAPAEPILPAAIPYPVQAAASPGGLAATRTRRRRIKKGGDDDEGTAAPRVPGAKGGKRGQRVKIKPPADVTGYAYDANGIGFDRELDSDPDDPPATEEQFILRLPPKLAKKMAPRVEGRSIGEDTYFKFKDSRRAVFHVDGKDYSAKLVDLPAIVESQRFTGTGGQTLKVADISQMLLVEDRVVRDENEVVEDKTFNIEDFIYPHGLAPPLRHVRKRRFRRRINKRNIELIENAVEKLLEADAKAEQVQYEYLDRYMSDEEDDANNAAQNGFRVAGGRDNDSIAAGTPNAMDDGGTERDENEEYDEDDGSQGGSEAPGEGGDDDDDEEDEGFDSDLANEINKGLEAMNKASSTEDSDSDDDDDEGGDDLFGGSGGDDDDDDDDDNGDGAGDGAEGDDAGAAVGQEVTDPVVLEKRRRVKLLAEEASNLDKAIASKEAELAKNQNPIFKKRFEEMIKKLTSERDLKRNQHAAAVRDLEKSTTSATEAAMASEAAQIREEDKMDES